MLHAVHEEGRVKNAVSPLIMIVAIGLAVVSLASGADATKGKAIYLTGRDAFR
jgi:hypothetical protein